MDKVNDKQNYHKTKDKFVVKNIYKTFFNWKYASITY